MLDFYTIGRNISSYRQNLNMTQEDLAESLNLSPDYISKLETGYKHASIATLNKFSNFFKIDIYDLFVESNIKKDEYLFSDIYPIVKKWEPETRRVLHKTAESFYHIDKRVKEQEDE